MRWGTLAMVVLGAVLLPWRLPAQDRARSAEMALDHRVSLEVTDADLRDVLKALFDQARADHVIERDVVGRVTASLTDRPLRVALDMVLRSVASERTFTYRLEDGVVHVGVRPEPAPEPEGERDQASTRPRRAIERIQLRNVDAATMAERLEMAGLGQVLYLPGMASGLGGQRGWLSGDRFPSFGGSAIVGFPGLGGASGYGVFEGFRTGGLRNPGGRSAGGLGLGILR